MRLKQWGLSWFVSMGFNTLLFIKPTTGLSYMTFVVLVGIEWSVRRLVVTVKNST